MMADALLLNKQSNFESNPSLSLCQQQTQYDHFILGLPVMYWFVQTGETLLVETSSAIVVKEKCSFSA
jgi:hypothetical protein